MATRNTDAIHEARQRHRRHARHKTLRYLLEDDNRRALYDQAEKTPGLNITQLSQAIDIPRTTASYHLARLEANDLLTLYTNTERGNEKLCFLPHHAHLYNDEKTRPLFGAQRTRRIARYIAHNPGATIQEIARAFEVTYGAIKHHTDRLRELDLIHRTRTGGSYRHEPTHVLTIWEQDIGTCFPP